MAKIKYKTGQFSRLGRVTVRTLRHYEKIGLLKPGIVDMWTASGTRKTLRNGLPSSRSQCGNEQIPINGKPLHLNPMEVKPSSEKCIDTY